MVKRGIRNRPGGQKKKRTDGPRKADDRDGYQLTPHDKQNEQFERYYRKQRIVADDEEWDRMLAAMRMDLPTAFRVCRCLSDTQALIRLVESFIADLASSLDSDVHVPEPIEWAPGAYQTKMSRTAVRSHPILKQFHNFLVTEAELGNISRQEAVSLVPPMLLDVKPEHAVLDLCAAPGSKTQQIIEMMHEDGRQPEGFVVANDVDNSRCYLLVHQALKRMPTTNCVVINEDATRLPKFHFKDKDDVLLFDRVLCDVICSGDGTTRKNPDVWRRWSPHTAIALHKLQVNIAKRGLEQLKPGGLMVYSTCSLNPIEDEAVIAELLRTYPGSLELDDVSQRLPGLKRSSGLVTWKVLDKEMNEYDSYDQVPESLRKAITNSMFPPTSSEVESMKLNRSFRILPHQQDTGGFFIAVLRKKSMVNAVDHRPDTIGNASSKRQQKGVFKEDPFVFMEKNDERWDNIANHYGIANNFPHEQLLSRTADSEKKRTLYFVNAAIKRFLLYNPGVKVVNAGLRMFGRVEMKFETCRFRVAQDGVRELLPYMQNRVVDVSREDLHKVMIGFEGSDNVPRSTLACDEALNSLDSGSVVLRTQHEGQDHVICVWMGKKSVAAYITKEERIHLIRMLGFDTSEMESTMSSKRKDKAARDRIQAEENRRIENGNGAVANAPSEVEGQTEQ